MQVGLSIYSLLDALNKGMSLEDAMAHSEDLYLDAACRLLRSVRCGMEMRGR